MTNDQRQIEENNAWDKLSMWETMVDHKIQQWIGDGDMSEHPSAGQPLQLDDDSNTPEDKRVTYKIMKDNDVVPPWLSKAHALQDKHEKIERRVRHYARDYVRRRRNARRKGSFLMERDADERWQRAINSLRDDIEKYNRELLDYNLMTPPQIGQKPPLDAGALIDQALRHAETARMD